MHLGIFVSHKEMASKLGDVAVRAEKITGHQAKHVSPRKTGQWAGALGTDPTLRAAEWRQIQPETGTEKGERSFRNILHNRRLKMCSARKRRLLPKYVNGHI